MSKEEEKPVAEGEAVEGGEAEEKEDEVVDVELQKEMKGIKIEDSDFGNVAKPKKKDKKEKESKDDKKGKKKKGQDFIDYANKNNIQINIEYEENKYVLKKTDDPKVDQTKGGVKPNDNRRGHNPRGGFRGGYRGRPQKRPFKFTSGNKFDVYNQRFPYQYSQGQNFQQHQIPALTEDKDILTYLESMFGEQNLNKDTYLRKKLSEKGTILVDDVVAYNDIKKNNIVAQKILDVIKESENLESVTENEKTYIQIKNFDKLNLLTMEQLYSNKKNRIKMYYPQPQQQIPFAGYNYINMQNNYIFPAQYMQPYIPYQDGK